ncbi:hypothetical protein HYH03_011253 [Edaphochlamys debaryana]|uniref:Uncharacterized protein n=1 Tax=Edaphochlamys debaryana TaxID=47281 RepID=A0A836BVR2_9CHLO|nr:hypothetical protein HYH03_011253 [Edaphochlamys debaryana]|eukprot:KAG2490302.1 hypothetical protein HYH03_011253 [Edaphochlamys debaryana]
MAYPKCTSGFHNVACCICSPNCPDGMTDVGAMCQQQTYPNGAGVALQCRDDEDQGAAMCYPKCPEGYKGVGPVCWRVC